MVGQYDDKILVSSTITVQLENHTTERFSIGNLKLNNKRRNCYNCTSCQLQAEINLD